MFNRVRTLLLNESADSTFPYGEEAVPDEFVPRRSNDLTRLGLRAVFGDNPDRAMKNWMLGLYAPMLHCRAADRFARRQDARVSYWPAAPRAVRPDWSVFGTAEVVGPDGLVVLGQPTHTYRLLRRLTVSSPPNGPVTVRNEKGDSEVSTVVYSGGLSTPVKLLGGLSVIVPSAGGEWQVTTVGRPYSSPAETLIGLESTGLLGSWFARDAEMAEAFAASGHVPEKLGIALIALAELIDLAR